MKKEDFFPKSTQINFTLKTTAEVTKDPEFKKLVEASDNQVLTFKMEAKKMIMKTAELELKTWQKNLKATHMKNLRTISMAFVVSDGFNGSELDETLYNLVLSEPTLN